MTKKILLGMAALVMAVLLMPAAGRKAYAEWTSCPSCGSDNFDLQETYHEYLSSKEHNLVSYYMCWNCDNQWEDRDPEPHHAADGSSVCYECSYPSGNRTLTFGKWTCARERPWMKVVVKKSGYLMLHGEYPPLSLYNSKKKKYEDAWFLESGVPVKKGTYYLRPDDDAYGNFRLKVTFHTAKDQRNYKKSKAAKLTRNKYKTVVIYSADKKKTWGRWYKIKITKKKKICIWGYDARDMIINAEGCPVKLKEAGDNKYVSAKKLKKGTYYFYPNIIWTKAQTKRTTGIVFRFKWNYK